MIIRMVDTRSQYHKPVTRPLNGTERDGVKSCLTKRQAANYREELVRDKMEFGENIPHDVRKTHIYRQVRMEAGKQAMGRKPRENLSVIQSLQQMATSALYKGSLHDLGALRFYVIYCSTHQVLAYQEYVRLMRKNSQICIDASGKMVKNFEICPGKQTGHIFLYTMTVLFQNKTLCIYQVLTEIHTQEFIEYWLKLFLRLGASAPGRVVSDYERAIPMSASLAFNNMSFKEYIDTCYLWAISEHKDTSRPTKTLIRIDVAHLMHLVAGWTSVKSEKHKTVKETRLHCVALMVDATTMKKFSRIFILTQVISLHPFTDTIITIDGVAMTVSEALHELEEVIGDRDQSIKLLEQSMTAYEENKRDEKIPEFTEGDNDTLTHKFIKKLIQQAQPCPADIEGKSVNGFYNEEFSKALERLGKEFPAWTGITEPYSNIHASSASQEGYFARLRQSMREAVQLPCSADRFVGEHLKRLQSGTNELGAQLKHANHAKKPPSPSATTKGPTKEFLDEQTIPSVPPTKPHIPDDSDLKSYEPWRGLKNKGPFSVDSASSEDDELKAEENVGANPVPKRKANITVTGDDDSLFNNEKDVYTEYHEDGPIMEDVKRAPCTSSDDAKKMKDDKASFVISPESQKRIYIRDDSEDPFLNNRRGSVYDDYESNGPIMEDAEIPPSTSKCHSLQKEIFESENKASQFVPNEEIKNRTTIQPESGADSLNHAFNKDRLTSDMNKCNSMIKDDCAHRSFSTSQTPTLLTSPLLHPNFRSTPLADHSYALPDTSDTCNILKEITSWHNNDKATTTQLNSTQLKEIPINTTIGRNGNIRSSNAMVDKEDIITISDTSESSSSQLLLMRIGGPGQKLLAQIQSRKKKVEHVGSKNHGLAKRMKTGKDEKSKQLGYYFQNQKELRIKNQRIHSKKKGLIFPNGNRCIKPLTIKLNDKPLWKFESKVNRELLPKEVKVRPFNTCGFDSILHVLEFGVIDHPLYESLVKDSNSETIKLLLSFMKKGTTAEVHLKRLRLLNTVYDIEEPQVCLLPYQLNAVDSLDIIWQRFLASEPSGCRSFSCNNPRCNVETTPMHLLHVNERILIEGGYKDLDKALQYHPVNYNKECRLKCGCGGVEHTTLNIHICISLDVREPTNKLSTMEGHLDDFPHYLYLEKRYRLVGIIHHEPGISLLNEKGYLQYSEPGHFSAYIFRASGSWIHCDDLEDNINYKCKPSRSVKPHAAIYVICETESDI